MKKIAVTSNCGKDHASDVLKRLADGADGLGLELVCDEETGKLLRSAQVKDIPAMFDGVDAVMALGGDGTMLRVVRALDGRDIPVIGVNIGSLGFLTSVAEEQLDSALQCLAKDDFVISNRTIAECVVTREGELPGRHRALNDIVITKGGSPRVVTLDVSVAGDHVASYVCDGLIVSTPAGSTGHSLSAGGPILVPDTRAFVISLMCPHTLSSRPLVVSDSSEIVVKAVDSDGDLLLTVDGQVGEPLAQGDTVTVCGSDTRARFIHLPGHSYFGVLRQKLHWRGSNV